MITGRRAARALVGKTIASVELRAFDGGRLGRTKRNRFDPVVAFTDGTRLTFDVQETEIGTYGVDLQVQKASS